MKCKYLTLEDVYNMTKKLASKIKAAGFKPDTIVGLARGGWIPARLMCDFLGVVDLISLKVEHWIETGKTKDEAIIKYPVKLDHLAGKKVLLLDDITDTGKSLMVSKRYVEQFNPAEVKTATMQFIVTSKFKPDFYAEEVREWTWFIYPWNYFEDTTTLVQRLMADKELWTLEEIKEGLRKYFEIDVDLNWLREVMSVMEERKQVKKVVVEGVEKWAKA
ncbi:MAG: phosphoribosyltransferase [Candidatus Methanomethylicota archaeon]|nr:MAG: phosphoribosyltransferase [Candidatus Verstraetearchaeota archaeon]